MFFFFKEDAHQATPKVAANFWRTILLVELTDLVFSIDSITTAVAMTDKLSVVWIGGIMGLICLRFMSNYFIDLLDKFPKLEDLAYQIVFFVGIKLVLDGFGVHMEHVYFWLTMGVIAVLGASLLYRDQKQKHSKTQYHDRILEDLKQGKIKITDIWKMEMIPVVLMRKLEKLGYLTLKDSLEDNPSAQPT